MDGMGNLLRIPDALQLDSGTANNTKTARSLIVLRRPSFSFQGCSPENPTPLLIGSDAPLKLFANVADPLDGPWELLMKYVPGVATEENAKATLSKVSIGEADASIVYVTDVKASKGTTSGVKIADKQNVVATYPPSDSF